MTLHGDKRFLIGLSVSLWLCFLLTTISQGLPNPDPNQYNNFHHPPVPPQANCFNFPGTQEWNHCWDEFRARMHQFQEEMRAYQLKINTMNNPSGGSDGATTSAVANGYRIRSNGAGIGSNFYNGQMSAQVFLGPTEKLDMSSANRTIRWVAINNGTATKWVTLTPPEGVNLNTIKYELKDNTLYILAPPSPNSDSVITTGASIISYG